MGADVIEIKESAEDIDIKYFIPDVASLHVIITSRSSTAKDMTQLDWVPVGEMEEAQAVELFYRTLRSGAMIKPVYRWRSTQWPMPGT
jgi:hypothetical protein